ncbi:MAG: PAS domain S-box protein, partial [Phycisphaerae bacterium]|nr:PAS domain S-box protein [Phycisphaerae bacterium]
MEWTPIIATALQLVAAAWAAYLFARMRTWQTTLLFFLFSLMALRRIIGLAVANTPGRTLGPFLMHDLMESIVLIISVCSVAAVGFLHHYLQSRAKGEREVRFLASALADSATPTLITNANPTPRGLVIEFANDAMLDLTGFERHEMIGHTMTEVFGLDEERDTPARVTSAVARGLPVVTECTTRRKDGTHRWVTCSMSPIKDPSGRASRLLWVKHDITARRLVEEQLRTEQQRYQRIVETANEGVWLTDANWRTTYVNARMAEMLGCTPQEMIGKHASDFVFDSDRPALLENMRRRERGEKGHHDERLRCADGSELWTLMSTNAFFDEHNNFAGALAMVTDIGDRRIAEAHLRAALQKLSFHFDNSPLAVIEWDRDFRVGTWSSGAERIFGWTATEVVG